MTLKTRLVRLTIDSANATRIAGATVCAELTKQDFDGLVVVPSTVIGVTDVNGSCVLNLWPNSLGTQGSQYRVTAVLSGLVVFTTICSVPDGDALVEVDLHSIINTAPYPTVDASLQALINAQVKVDEASAFAVAAEASSLAASEDAYTAEVHKVNAEQAATNAATQAGNALTQATNAGLSATEASDYATASLASANSVQSLFNRIYLGA